MKPAAAERDEDTGTPRPTPEGEDGARPASPEVLQTLLENHTRFLRFLEARVGRRELAEDILQEALARGVDRGGSVRDGESVVAWFYRVLRNALVDHHRRADAERRALGGAAAEPAPDVAAPDEALMNQVCSCVTGMLGALKPDHAQALRRVDLEGADVATFAREVGITANNAGVRLHRAREALRKQLAETCGTCSLAACLDCSC